MATPRFAWGIDIGNRALKAVKLISTAEGLAIDDFDVIEHESVLSAAGDNRDGMIQSALANFVARHPGIEKGQVGVGVTGQQSFARFIKLPPVEKKKIPEIVRFEAIQQIPFPLDEVEWSYQLFEEADSPEVEVGIFAMRKDLVNSHIKFFTDAKLNVQVVQMNPLSVYNGMYYDSRIKGTTMIIDVGAENTDLIIAEGETIWMRSISIGGNNFTEALTKAFKVNFAKAEDLKRNASTSKYGRQIMQAMRPIFSDLVSEIQRSIGFYSSVHKESRISKVVAVGSTFRLPGLERYLSQNLTLEVKRLDGLGTGPLEDPKLAATFSENLLSAAGAYGLALQVMGQGKISSSLLPESIRRDKMWAEKTKWFIGTAALFMVGAGIAYGRIELESSQFTDQEHVALQGQIDQVKTLASTNDSKWSVIAQAGGAEKQRMLNILGLSKGRQVWPQINTLIYDTLPQNGPDAPKELGSSNPLEIKKIKRSERNQIIVAAMVSRYVPDLNGVDPIADSAAVLQIPFESSGGGGADPFSRTDYGTPAALNTDASAAAAKPQRGFIITLRVTTPNERGADLVESFNDALKALTPTADRPLQVLQAKIAHQSRFSNDTNRMAAFRAAWTAKQAEKARIAQQAAQQAGPGGGTPGGGVMPPPGGGYQGPGGGYRPNGGGFNPPAGFNNIPGGGPGVGTGVSGETLPEEAYQDPVLKEDMRNDTECIVVLTVAVDPPAATTPAKGAPASPVIPVSTPGRAQ